MAVEVVINNGPNAVKTVTHTDAVNWKLGNNPRVLKILEEKPSVSGPKEVVVREYNMDNLIDWGVPSE